jgi:hypothetical protein
MPKQNIGKASRGGPDIQRKLANYLDFSELVERTFQL